MPEWCAEEPTRCKFSVWSLSHQFFYIYFLNFLSSIFLISYGEKLNMSCIHWHQIAVSRQFLGQFCKYQINIFLTKLADFLLRDAMKWGIYGWLITYVPGVFLVCNTMFHFWVGRTLYFLTASGVHVYHRYLSFACQWLVIVSPSTMSGLSEVNAYEILWKFWTSLDTCIEQKKKRWKSGQILFFSSWLLF